jgi:hypothetical protein
MSQTKVEAPFVENNATFKNMITNGDMQVSQRGTSFASMGNGDSQYTLDRWEFEEEGSFGDAEITVSQDTDVPTGEGFAKSLKCVCATADTSIDSGTIGYISQKFEGQMLQHLAKGTSGAKKTTLSFFCKSNLTSTFTISLNDSDNTRMFSTSYSLSSANTWEKITINIPADTTGALDNDNQASFHIRWNLQAGTNKSSGSLASAWETQAESDRAVGQTNFFSSTSNNWYITGVQWEVGDAATDFEHLPFDVQERRCFRYFQTLAMVTNSIKVGAGTSTTVAQIDFEYPNGEMRTSPTITLPAAGNSSGTTAFLTAVGAYPSTIGTHSVSTATEIHARVTCASYSANLLAGSAHLFYSNGTNTFKMDAEL